MINSVPFSSPDYLPDRLSVQCSKAQKLKSSGMPWKKHLLLEKSFNPADAGVIKRALHSLRVAARTRMNTWAKPYNPQCNGSNRHRCPGSEHAVGETPQHPRHSKRSDVACFNAQVKRSNPGYYPPIRLLAPSARHLCDGMGWSVHFKTSTEADWVGDTSWGRYCLIHIREKVAPRNTATLIKASQGTNTGPYNGRAEFLIPSSLLLHSPYCSKFAANCLGRPHTQKIHSIACSFTISPLLPSAFALPGVLIARGRMGLPRLLEVLLCLHLLALHHGA